MLLLIEIFDTIAGIFVLTEVCLVLLRIKFRFFIPQLQLLHVHCKHTKSVLISRTSTWCTRTFVDGVGDLVKGTTIALLGSDSMSGGGGGSESGHGRRGVKKR
jgi:hypothetical protein